MIDASEDFHEVSEIMSRHATLLATNTDLRQQQQRMTDLAEESRCAGQQGLHTKQSGCLGGPAPFPSVTRPQAQHCRRTSMRPSEPLRAS